MMMVWTDTAEAGLSIVTASAATRFYLPGVPPMVGRDSLTAQATKTHGECNCFSNSDGLRILTSGN